MIGKILLFFLFFYEALSTLAPTPVPTHQPTPSFPQYLQILKLGTGSTSYEAGIDMSRDGNSVVHVYDESGGGYANLYTKLSGVWSLSSSWRLPDSPNGGYCSSGSLSANASTLAVGCNFDTSGTGATYIYDKLPNGTWQQTVKLVGTGGVGGGSGQGYHVELSDDGMTVAVGGNPDLSYWVFANINGTWQQEGSKVSGYSGLSLSSDGNTLATGPSVRIRTAGVWSTQSTSFAGSSSVSLSSSGDVLALGGGNSNGVRFYKRDSGVWTQQQFISAPGVTTQGDNAYPGTWFGSISLSSDGKTVAAGAPGDNSRIGATVIFTEFNNVWVQVGSKLLATGITGYSDPLQGYNVRLSGDASLLADFVFGGNSDSGEIFLFSTDTSSPSKSPSTTTPSRSPSRSPITSIPSKSPSTTTPSKSPSTTKPSTSPVTVTPSKSPTKSPTFTSRLILYSDNELTDGNMGTYDDAYTRCNEEQLLLNLECTKVEPFLYFGDEYEDKLPGNLTGLPIYDMYGTPIASDWTALVGTSTWTNSLRDILNYKSWTYGTPNCNNWQSSSDCLNGLIQNPTATKFSNKRAGCNTPKTILCLCQGNKELPDRTYRPTISPTTSIPTKSPTTTGPTKSPITNSPSKTPSKAPSRGPSLSPITSTPSKSPSKSPTTNKPSKSPSKSPIVPTTAPTSAGVRLSSPSDGMDGRVFGQSVAISQDKKTLIVGNPGGFSWSGGAFVYFKNSSDIWGQQGPELVTSGGPYSAEGFSVSISGNTIAVGATGANADLNGEVYVYTRSGTTWTLQQTLAPRSLSLVYDYVGYSVSLSSTDGNTLAIGASEGSNPSLGGVYIFTRSGSVWTQQAALQATGTLGSTSNCGNSVSLSSDGDTLATGCFNDGSVKGAVYIFTRSLGVWSQQAKLIGTPSSAVSRQGWSVSLSSDGNMAAFGATLDDSSKGAVFVFTRSGISWTQQEKIVPTDHTGTTIYFGSSVSLSSDGSRLTIGGYSDDTNKGASWIYSRSGAVWSQYLTKKREVGLTSQGYSISLSPDGTTFVAGSSTSGVIVVYDI